MVYFTGYGSSTDKYGNEFLFNIVDGDLLYVICKDFNTKMLTSKILIGDKPNNSLEELWNTYHDNSYKAPRWDIPQRWFD